MESGFCADHASINGGVQMSLTRLCVLVLSTALACPASACAAPNPLKPCSSAEYHQFDFFVGDWDTYDVGVPGKVVARNRVDLILDGCVVHEDYQQNDEHHGESYSLYDVAHGSWHQSWVTNRGELLLLDGGLQNDLMILTGSEKTKDGKSSLLRGVWIRQTGGVRETATRSTDGGKSWQPVFDIVFLPHQN
jgi:hypothetical protein